MYTSLVLPRFPLARLYPITQLEQMPAGTGLFLEPQPEGCLFSRQEWVPLRYLECCALPSLRPLLTKSWLTEMVEIAQPSSLCWTNSCMIHSVRRCDESNQKLDNSWSHNFAVFFSFQVSLTSPDSSISTVNEEIAQSSWFRNSSLRISRSRY